MAPKPPDPLRMANRVQVAKAYIALWQQYFSYFADSLKERAITPEEEEEFGAILSQLAFEHFKFSEMAGDWFKDDKKILDVLQETVSLEEIKLMPDATFGKIQIEWHTLFLGMYKALGKMTAACGPKDIEELKMMEVASGGSDPAAGA